MTSNLIQLEAAQKREQQQHISLKNKKKHLDFLPSDWSICALEEIGQCLIGLTYEPRYVSPDGLLVLRSSNIGNYTLQLDDFVFVSMEIPDQLILREDDLLICVRNGSRPLIGKCTLIDHRASGMTFGAFMSVFRSADNRFVFYCFQSDIVKHQIHEHLGATINQITNRSLNSFLIPYPSAKERHVIADVLSDVDGLITSLEALIAKKKAIKQATMQQLLTGKTRLPGFSGERTELNMARDSILKARIGWQGLTTEEYLTTGNYYLVTGTDFLNGRVDWSTCHFVDRSRFVQDTNIQLVPSDVLLTKDGTIGKAGFIDSLPGPATLNSGVFVIRPKKKSYFPKYMYYILTSHIFSNFLGRLQAGSTIVHLYQKDFSNFSFNAPPLNEQVAIATILSDMDAELASLQQRLDKTREIKHGMMQQLLTGLIRLVKPV